jgi:hypothetical protein
MQSARRDYRQEFWWKPGQSLPERAPVKVLLDSFEGLLHKRLLLIFGLNHSQRKKLKSFTKGTGNIPAAVLFIAMCFLPDESSRLYE